MASVTLPRPASTYNVQDQSETRLAIEQALQRALVAGEDHELARGERIILRSPDGSRFALAVDNSGVLSATAL